MDNQKINVPLYETLKKQSESNSISFHVPGHKNGQIFSDYGKESFKNILSLDLTELAGLDDLHAPQGVIAESLELAAKWFRSKTTYFLVGGSTVGNLAMILATCNPGEKVIVQRNSHKSILNGLELSGALPIFISPEYDEVVDRFTAPSLSMMKIAIESNPDAKAVILTYPDYFGRTYDIESIISVAHKHKIPVLVDEAHGVHFSLGSIFPNSSVRLGADIVVQSAHKMAPAMTMASYLHINKSSLVSLERIHYFLQMLQSSSPSYPLLASLDLARAYLENITLEDINELQISVNRFKDELNNSNFWSVLDSIAGIDDPLKITIQSKSGYTGRQIAEIFERQQIYPELSTHNQILFIHGLAPFNEWERLIKAIKNINDELKITPKRATIENKMVFNEPILNLTLSYQEMIYKSINFATWDSAIGLIAGEAVIPYPPGIPIIFKGEKITEKHKSMIKYLLSKGISFQNKDITIGLNVFS